jgi:hypothetical protein
MYATAAQDELARRVSAPMGSAIDLVRVPRALAAASS